MQGYELGQTEKESSTYNCKCSTNSYRYVVYSYDCYHFIHKKERGPYTKHFYTLIIIIQTAVFEIKENIWKNKNSISCALTCPLLLSIVWRILEICPYSEHVNSCT